MEEYTQITLDEWTSWKEDIRRKLAETANNFVYIGYRLKQIRDSGMYDGAADIFEFAEREYGLGKSTVSRFIAINTKYSEGGNSLEMKEEFKNFSSSKLAEMLTLPDNEIELITEKTTIREIRELKNFNNREIPGEMTGQEAGKHEMTGQETVEQAWTPLQKCLIDYFKDREEMLNGIMACMEADPPAYKEAAERMAPSGQASHKKGLVFLFLYDWNTGVKYKLLTQPDPVSITWQELLNEIYRIYGSCPPENVWGTFYKAGKKAENEKNEKAVPPQSNQGLAPSVATSQQEETAEKEKNVENEAEKPETPSQNAGYGESGQEETGETAGEHQETEEIRTESGEESEESVEKPDAETLEEEQTAAGEEDEENEEENEAAGGKYAQTIAGLIDDAAYKAGRIAKELQTGTQKSTEEYRKIRASVNSLYMDLGQLIRFIDLSQEDEE